MTTTVTFGVRRGFAQTVTRLRAAQLTSTRGLPVVQRDWGHADSLIVVGVAVQPWGSMDAKASDARKVTSNYWLSTPPRSGDVDIARGDRVAWGALTLEVQGDPERWPAVTGGVDHVEVFLQVAPPWPGAGGESSDGQVSAAADGAASSYGWTP